jgi:hypothetical protein
MTESHSTGLQHEATPADQAHESGRAPVDVQALAEKVYQLLKEEARLERERLGRLGPR